MKFLITRTSQWAGQPCDEAYQDTYTRIDERTVRTPDKLPNGQTWYQEGTNHRVEDGHIKRDFQDTAWFVDIPDLDALMVFYQKYGQLVISSHYNNDAIVELEIYDDYRE